MFDIFTNRNKSVTNLIKMGTYLGRSLRENVQLFTVDSNKNQVCYLTESGSFITGTYDTKGILKLNNIKTQSSEILSNEVVFDAYINEQVSNFVSNISNNQFNTAEISFSDILSLWEERFKLKNMQKLISEKRSMNESHNVLNTDEYRGFTEISTLLTRFIVENSENIFDADLINSIRKIKLASTAFNLAKETPASLMERGSYSVNESIDTNLYEALCKNELIRKELLESKRSFEQAWTSADTIKVLSRLVNEKDETKIEMALVEAITEVPYLAMASKGQIVSVINSNMIMENIKTYKDKDIRDFASRLFEMKKPIRSVINKLLSEKYHINVLNLKDPVSLKSIAEDSSSMFALLAERVSTNITLTTICKSMSDLLKVRGGVEVIDVNEAVCSILGQAGINIEVPDFKLVEKMDFAKVFDKDFNVGDVIRQLKEASKVAEAPTDVKDAPPETKEVASEEIVEDEVIHEKEDFLSDLKNMDDIFSDIFGPKHYNEA